MQKLIFAGFQLPVCQQLCVVKVPYIWYQSDGCYHLMDVISSKTGK